MPSNLKARLGRIRQSVGGETGGLPAAAAAGPGEYSWPGWRQAGFHTLKRELSRELSFPVPVAFPRALAALVPDFARAGRLPAPEELLFFDLETTGLSTGAGTVAFLAAFGRFADGGGPSPRVAITQYLLLDYPGEADFVRNVAAEFSPQTPDAPPFVVSYNGKSFDSPILNTRCLMSGIKPPAYAHADLLHPARRLWRKELTDCSQATVEASVLGLDRRGDLPGALAPDIWFSFLRSGGNGELLLVCDHNARDITGLASLLLGLAEIASAPLESRSRFRVSEADLALSWRSALKKTPLFFGSEEQTSGELLLQAAARSGCPHAAIALAKTAEWQQGNPALALAYTDRALQEAALSAALRQGLEKRRARLLGKIARLPS